MAEQPVSTVLQDERPHTTAGSWDLVISRAAVKGWSEPADIFVREGMIAEVRPSDEGQPAEAENVVDAAGRIVLPGLIEAHIHLEKAYLLDKVRKDAQTLSEAISLTAEAKQQFTPADMRDRALRVLRRAVRHGVTTLRCHVELDDTLSLTAMETMLELRHEVRDSITLQVAAFPQEGIFQQHHGPRLMQEAMSLGADVVGGIPYNDYSSDEHLDFVFELAQEFNAPLDLHIDFSDNPAQRDILKAVERTHQAGMQGSVTAGHLTSLGSVPAAEAQEMSAAIAEAGISVVTLPATDVYLNGREDEYSPRRGLTPVRTLMETGANVALATNNIQNPFTPFGRGNILDTAVLLAELCHMGTARDAERVVDMMTENAASAIQVPGYGVQPGSPADLVMFEAESARGVLTDCFEPLKVWKNGQLATPEELPK